MLLAGRVRKPEEEAVILSILAKNFKRTVNPEELFSQKQLTSQFSECGCCSAFAAAHFSCAFHNLFKMFFRSVFLVQQIVRIVF